MDWINKIKDIVIGPQVSDEFLKEKRIAPRINCQIEANICDEKENHYEGFVIVLEYFGMRCIVPVRFKRGQKLRIMVKEFSGVLGPKRPFSYETMNTEVVWCRKRRGSHDYYIGVRLTDTCDIIDNSWVNFVLASFGITDSPYVQKRKEIRVLSRIPVKCYYSKHSFTCGVVADISLGGLKMYFNIDPGEGKDLVLEIGPYKKYPLIRCSARVLRSRFVYSKNKFEIGVQFAEIEKRQMKALSKYIIGILRESRI